MESVDFSPRRNREQPKRRPVLERIKDFHEIESHFDLPHVQSQATRCMDCGIPFCHCLGCPLGNLIPEWCGLASDNHLHEAFLRLDVTNPLPEITGRVCPAFCESSCSLGITDEAVSIRAIELSIIELAFHMGWIQSQKPHQVTGKKVAVCGSGPAGLAAAQFLRRRGHTVVVFERSEKPGGMLRYGIADFRLEKWVIDRRLQQLQTEGIEFETRVMLGEDLSARYMTRTFHGIIIALGSTRKKTSTIRGAELKNIYFAIDYLEQASGESSSKTSAQGKNVIIVGDNQGALDCAGVALRQGALSVTVLSKNSLLQNPNQQARFRWPDKSFDPLKHPSLEEGCTLIPGIIVQSFEGNSDHVESVRCVEKNNSTQLPETERSFPADLVILTSGTTRGEHSSFIHQLGLTYDENGIIKTSGSLHTPIPGVYVAGDCFSGPSSVVNALHQGLQAAELCDLYLKTLQPHQNKVYF